MCSLKLLCDALLFERDRGKLDVQSKVVVRCSLVRTRSVKLGHLCEGRSAQLGRLVCCWKPKESPFRACWQFTDATYLYIYASES